MNPGFQMLASDGVRINHKGTWAIKQEFYSRDISKLTNLVSHYKMDTCAVDEHASLRISWEYFIEKLMDAVPIYKHGCRV